MIVAVSGNLGTCIGIYVLFCWGLSQQEIGDVDSIPGGDNAPWVCKLGVPQNSLVYHFILNEHGKKMWAYRKSVTVPGYQYIIIQYIPYLCLEHIPMKYSIDPH